MRYRLLFIFLFLALSNYSEGQVITTVAGNGNGTDGTPAITAHLYDPNGIVFDKRGNLYIATNAGHTVRKIDTAGIITTIAGTGNGGFSGDNGPAATAELNQPADIAIDTAGNIYIADAANHRIRKITVSTGIITTVVGNGLSSFSGDNGSAISASINMPTSVCFDKEGNLFIADNSNYRIRKVDKNGIITTVAGIGLHGCDGDNGLAVQAKCSPQYVRINATGDICLAEWDQFRVRKINSSGIISTIAGDSASYVYNGDSIPATEAYIAPVCIAFNRNNELIVSDYNNSRIRKIDNNGIIYTIVGNGTAGNTGDSGLATNAKINSPCGLAIDSCDNLYFGQVNTPRIRKVTFNPNCSITDTTTAVINIAHEDNDIDIYPNPANENLTVSYNSNTAEISIINTLGQTLIKEKSSGHKAVLNVASLSNGVYFIIVKDEQGSKRMKFIKE